MIQEWKIKWGECIALVQEIAEIVRKELNLSVPINSTQTASLLNLRCEPCKDNSFFAKTEHLSDTDYRILFDRNADTGFLNFAIAEEIGRAIFRETGFDSILSPRYNMLDVAVSGFAAELLMPKQEFFMLCENNQTKDGRINIGLIAKHFRVSKQAAYRRGVVLNIWDEVL